MYPSRELDKVVIRMPNGMRPRIAELARANHRSVNGEIVFHLANVLARQGKPATGQSFQADPAAGPNDTALAGGPEIHR